MCERVGVMYAGQLVEEGPTAEVLFRPRHPYTRALIRSLPEAAREGPLQSIPGTPPEPGQLPEGCAFAPRCPLATDECRAAEVDLAAVGSHHSSRCIHVDRLDDERTRQVETDVA
jgi:oligopeptide/dipeptide ABC transporter ATP-binding protein